MSEVSFFDFEPISADVLAKAVEERKRVNEPAGKYANNTSFRDITGEDIFKFEENKKALVDDLNWLVKLTVEEFTFRKKWEEIQLLPSFIKDFAGRAKAQIWEPTDLNNEELTIKEIQELHPKIVLINDDMERLWTTMRYYCSSAEYNQAPGRFFKFLMVDDTTNKILGVSSVASDVISISDRDKFIGWTPEDKLKHKMLKYSAIGTTIVPTQPFGTNFLGGKLMAAMITSKKVRDAWESTSGEGVPCKLVGMTTTSLYGNSKGNFSMYNGLKWWKPVGLSKGKVPIKPYEEGYQQWHQWLKQNMKDEYDKAMTQKEGIKGPVTGAKMRVLNMIFKACGIKQSSYCHGFERGVYYSCFYENTKEFLQRKISEEQLIMKPLFKADVEAILEWWKPKAIERYKKLKAEGRTNPEKLFYNSMTNMPYEEAKKQFFGAVGR
jgi:hypothetical protein